MEERLVRKLMASIKCGSCGQHYEPINIDVLAHSEETWLLKAQCASCYTQSLVVAIIKKQRKLDMHRFLREFDGDFAALFGERRKSPAAV